MHDSSEPHFGSDGFENKNGQELVDLVSSQKKLDLNAPLCPMDHSLDMEGRGVAAEKIELLPEEEIKQHHTAPLENSFRSEQKPRKAQSPPEPKAQLAGIG
jgi:hypothetical protein